MDIGHWTLDNGHWTLDIDWILGIDTLDNGHWTLDIGHCRDTVQRYSVGLQCKT